MNPKIANLLAIEAGILVGLMSWLTYSRFPSPEPRTTAEMRESRVAPVTAIAPVNSVAPAFEASNQRPSTADYSADREQARLMAERSASLQSYYRAVAAESYTRSGLDNGSIAVDTPSYAVADQAAVVPTEYLAPPQTVIYYAPPIQTVVFSNPRRFGSRSRSTPRVNCPPPTATHQRLGVLAAGPSTCRVLSQANANAQSRPSGCRVLSQANASDPASQPAVGSRARRSR